MTVTSFARLGSANSYDNTLANLQTRQNNLSNLQEQLTSGKRVTKPSDDPTAAAQAERALNRLARIATDQRALESQRNSITQAESTLGDISEALQRVRELAVSAGNGSYSAGERKTVALEIVGLRNRILSLANSQDANGQPLFSALGSALKPFVGPVATIPDYSFNGLPGTSAADIYAIPGTLDGESAFMLQPIRDAAYTAVPSNSASNLMTGPIQRDPATGPLTGSSYQIEILGVSGGVATYNLTEFPADGSVPIVTNDLPADYSEADGFQVPGSELNVKGLPAMAGLSLNIKGSPTVINANDTIHITPNTSVFSTVDKLVEGITNAATSAQAGQAVTQALKNIDISLARISSVRGQAGDLLNRAESITAMNDKRNIEQEANRSRAEDLDMLKGISDFQNQTTGIQAALQSYSQIQRLSLFNFIS